MSRWLLMCIWLCGVYTGAWIRLAIARRKADSDASRAK
jgi:hypothetical protein